MMAAKVPTTRRCGTIPQAGADIGQASAIAPSAGRSLMVVLGLLLLSLGAIMLAIAGLLQVSGWLGAALVVGGASVLAAGVGLVSTLVHAAHSTRRRGRPRSARPQLGSVDMPSAERTRPRAVP
jgi:hypothetical protein